MGASPLPPQHPGVGDGGGKGQLGPRAQPCGGPLGWAGWGSTAGKFLAAKLLCRQGWALSHPHLGSFFGGSGFFLNEILQAGFAHQKGAV